MTDQIYYLGFVYEENFSNINDYKIYCDEFIRSNMCKMFELKIKHIKNNNIYEVIEIISHIDINKYFCVGYLIEIKNEKIYYRPEVKSMEKHYMHMFDDLDDYQTLFCPFHIYEKINEKYKFIDNLKYNDDLIKIFNYLDDKYSIDINELKKILNIECEWCELKKDNVTKCDKCNKKFCDDCRYGDDITPKGVNCCELNELK